MNSPMRSGLCTQNRITSCAEAWIGTPFVHRASLRGAGADCLGLVRGLWRELYGAEPWPLPPYAPAGGQTGEEHLQNILPQHLAQKPVAALGAGDLLLFALHPHLPPRHLGIALAGGRFIHALAPAGVTIAHLSAPWRRRVAGCYVFAPLTHMEGV